MSYSFSVKGADKAEATKAVQDEFAKVVEFQPVHARDRAQVEAAVANVLGLLRDDSTRQVVVNCNGSLGWSGGEPGQEEITSVCINVSAWIGDAK